MGETGLGPGAVHFPRQARAVAQVRSVGAAVRPAARGRGRGQRGGEHGLSGQGEVVG